MFIEAIAPIGDSISRIIRMKAIEDKANEAAQKSEQKQQETREYRDKRMALLEERIQIARENAETKAQLERDKIENKRQENARKAEDAQTRRMNAETKSREVDHTYRVNAAKAYTSQYKAYTQRMAEERRGKK